MKLWGERLTVVVLMALVAVGLVWILNDYEQFEERCAAESGIVESRFKGFMPVIIGTSQYMQPSYSYHCWINGEERFQW